MKVKISIDFSDAWKHDLDTEGIILAAFKKAGVKVTKFRTTYVESKDGMANMPHKLMLALLIIDSRCGLSWYLNKLGGNYTFTFKE